MTQLTQIEVEERMYQGGIARATRMMDKAEEQGRAHQNPYAKELFRDYVLPLAEHIKVAMLPRTTAGKYAAHVTLLRPLDPEAVAFLAVRTVIVALCGNSGDGDHRSLGYQIGKTVHNELVLEQLAEAAPELYFTLSRDLGRRMSKDERHRMTVMKMQAKERGIEWAEWDISSRHQVGLYLLGLLSAAGMVEIDPEFRDQRGKRFSRQVSLTPEISERIAKVKAFVAVTSPTFGPCVEPPIRWVNGAGGGFHTAQLRRRLPHLIKCHNSARHLTVNKPMPIVDTAVNALQETAWAINTKLLATIKDVAKLFSTAEIVTNADMPRPPQPSWLKPDTDKEKLDPAQAQEFKVWKRKMAEWYTARKLRGVRYNVFSSALRVADQFAEQKAIYFVYFADSRGRLYPMAYGVNPQGSDLQKALLHFAEGKPVNTPGAIRWFHVHGANKWGFDKATLADRHQWVIDRQDLIVSFADDPVNNRGWTEADCPLQFLAWCFEYKAWLEDTDGSFVSRIPISMDGSCNGLQNLSAMLRDEVGGQATNLTRNVQMEDIYRRVAEAATTRMENAKYTDERESLRLRWLQHGVKRGVVKRSVMTTPYGVTRSTATDYVITDYLAAGQAPVFEGFEFRKAASVLMEHVWPAIGDVIVKGTQAMSWLKSSARAIVKTLDDEPLIHWISPSGFPASQAYFEAEVHRIHTRLFGEEKIRVLTESDTPDVTKHAGGLAPNFVHSMDAAHLHRVAAAASKAGITGLAMIHDDYGTHAADSDTLFHLIRQEFVDMYEENDPVLDFCKRYPVVPDPPALGNLNIREVLDSPYFFS